MTQAKRILHYAYAGHHTIVLIRDNEFIELEGKGTPALLMKDFLTATIQSKPKGIDYFYFQMVFLKYLIAKMKYSSR